MGIKNLRSTTAASILGGMAAATFAAFWIIGVNRELWSTRIPDQTHRYAVRFKGDGDLFFDPRVGWFLDHGLWILFALLIVIFAVATVNKRRSRDGHDSVSP